MRGRESQSEDGERELARDLASVLAAVGSGVIMLDGTGRVRSMNSAAMRMLDGDVGEVDELVGPLGRDGLKPGIPETVELQSVTRPDRWFELTRYEAPDRQAGVLVLRDVTDRRRSQGLREAFLGMLSHELRTPVTSIYAAASLLRAPSGGLGDDQRAGLVEDISEEADRMLRLVEDLLVLAHFDGGLSLVREPSLLQRVIPPVVQRERRRWPDVTIDLRVSADVPVVTGDETSVQQVARNLISNAAKYGEGSPIEVEIAEREGAGGGATVRVLDRGPGVSPDEAEALFRPFFRSARIARASSGAGIGLYVCRQLVEAMGGRIWARAREGSGSEFGFWLPEYRLEPDTRNASLADEDGAPDDERPPDVEVLARPDRSAASGGRPEPSGPSRRAARARGAQQDPRR